MAGLDREPRDSTDPRRSGGHLGDDKDLRTTSPPSPGGTALCESDEHRTPGEDVTGRGRHPGGRPLKLTPKLVDLMVALIERGNPPRRAARLLHLSAPTYHRWMKKGAEQEHGVFRSFRDRIESAQAMGEAYLVGVVREAARTNPRLALEMLSRMNRRDWGK